MTPRQVFAAVPPPDVACEACGAGKGLVVKRTQWPHDEVPVQRLLCRDAAACNDRAAVARSRARAAR